MSTLLLRELPEAESSEAVRHIYAEIRRLCGVPMVPLIYRHLATLPGVLEWAWALVGPAMRAGVMQRAAWEVAARAADVPVARLPRAALRLIGIDAEGEREFATLLTAYNRSNPVNLLVLRCLAVHLGGGVAQRASAGAAGPVASAIGGASEPAWVPPPPIGALVPMADPHSVSEAARAAIMLLNDRGPVAEPSPLWPSLYRHFASRPPMLGLVALLVPPAFAAIDLARAQVGAQIEVEAGRLAGRLDPPRDVPPPAAVLQLAILAAIDRFTPVIPEMIVIGSMLARAMPEPAPPRGV